MNWVEAAWKGGCGQDWPPHINDPDPYKPVREVAKVVKGEGAML